jgi:endonuclease YncB( thermonuclease family)
MRIFFLCSLVVCIVPVSVVYGWQGQVVKVLDGDSIRVKKGRKIVEIRLYGIDTPEWKQPFGNKAKKFTRAALRGQTVVVKQRDVDRYGRVVALVWSSGKMVNRELVRNGYAWKYSRYCHQQPLCSELGRLEAEARRRRLGLWRGKNPVSPWQWKRENKYAHSRSKTRSYRYPDH